MWLWYHARIKKIKSETFGKLVSEVYVGEARQRTTRRGGKNRALNEIFVPHIQDKLVKKVHID